MDDGQNRSYDKNPQGVPSNYVHFEYSATLASKKITITVNTQGAGFHGEQNMKIGSIQVMRANDAGVKGLTKATFLKGETVLATSTVAYFQDQDQIRSSNVDIEWEQVESIVLE